jgi:2-dehydro-3-deoxygluconokinase
VSLSRSRRGRLDVLTAGEALWDLVAPDGARFEDAAALALRPGGAAVNVATRLAAMGHVTALAATVGDDALGRALRARVAALGIDVADVVPSPVRTGLVVVEVASPPRVVAYRTPGDGEARWRGARRPRVLVLTGITPSGPQASAWRRAADAASSSGTRVVVDINARARVWASARTPRPALLVAGVAHVVRASTGDLRVLRITESALRTAMRPGATLVLTDGPRAAVATGPFGRSAVRPAGRRGFAMGAGDAFTAALTAGLLDASDADLEGATFWRKILAAGHALAATCVALRGARRRGHGAGVAPSRTSRSVARSPAHLPRVRGPRERRADEVRLGVSSAR